MARMDIGLSTCRSSVVLGDSQFIVMNDIWLAWRESITWNYTCTHETLFEVGQCLGRTDRDLR